MRLKGVHLTTPEAAFFLVLRLCINASPAQLSVHFAAKPDGDEVRKRDEQHDQPGRKSNVEIAVGEVDFVSRTHIPEEQREDGDGGYREEGKKRGGNGKQYALKQAEAFKWEAENTAAAVLVMHGVFHRLW